MTLVRLFVPLCLSVMLIGCAGLRPRYLDAVKGKASQDEILKNLGEPVNTQTLDNGESLWFYRKREYSALSSKMMCRIFALRFDSRILREWEEHEVDCDAEPL